MAKKNNSQQKSVERPNRLMTNVIPQSVARAKKDIAQWRSALQQAENALNPRRLLLYNIYDEIMLDADVASEFQKIIDNVADAEFELLNDQNVADLEKTFLLQKTWFSETIEYAIQSKGWGHSLVEISELTSEGLISKVQLVKRRNVRPETGLFVAQTGDDKGVLFREDPSVAPWLFEFGKPDDLGFLNMCVPHVLYARFAQAAYSEFTEMFGSPFRYVKTPSNDQTHLNRLEQMMLNMGTSTYGIFNTDEEIEFIETERTDGKVFEGLIKLCSDKIIKIINRSIIGGNTGEGSRAKEEVGLAIQQVVTESYKRYVTDRVNEDVIPKLIALGYPFEGLRFAYRKSPDLKFTLEIVKELMKEFDLDPKWLEETFNIPILAKKAAGKTTEPGKPGAPKAEGDFFV